MNEVAINLPIWGLITALVTIISTLIILAWNFSNRFTKTETSINFLKDGISDLKQSLSNLVNERQMARFAQTNSPIDLTDEGQVLLSESGIREFSDRNLELIKNNVVAAKIKTKYDLQEYIFEYMNKVSKIAEEKFRDTNIDLKHEDSIQMKKYAYNNGIDLFVIFRVGAIYLRNKLLESDLELKD
jgi:hypothetical protein